MTVTKYDTPSGYEVVYGGYTPFRQKSQTLRNRVSWTRYYDFLFTNFYIPGQDTIWTHDYNYFNTGIEYSYDIHGNVDSMLNMASVGSLLENYGGNRFKYIAYKYDLISGKVNEVHYNAGFADEFYHRYDYDADNKLTDVYTTNNKTLLNQTGLEEHDAHYEYYKHGPLARMVIGQQQVQGLDYAYTLQGWLKGVNSTSLNADHDMGGDGKSVSSNQHVARDVYGFNLNYFSGDYLPIRAGVAPFPGHSGGMGDEYRPLFNGNISSMAVNIGKFNQPQLYNYKYDQLNRITRMDVYRGLNEATNSWSAIAAVEEYKERITYDGNGNINSYLRKGSGTNLNMDNLAYHYKPNSNQLDHVSDDVAFTSNYTVDIDNQNSGNYEYDSVGNMIKDLEGKVNSVGWNVYGKITNIGRVLTTASDVSAIDYKYDPSGNRVGKKVYMYMHPPYNARYTWYVRDAQGNVMAVYESDYNSSWSLGALRLKEHHIYGSSRLGIIERNQNMDSLKAYPVNEDLINATYLTQEQRGFKSYELSNHLGNVLATISDKKFGVGNFSGNYSYYTADVVNANDYYPFGMMMVGRKYSVDGGYRYGFNGKDNDNELKGEGNQIDYGARMYDPRLGRWLSLDPLQVKYPELTPYHFCVNNPINFLDYDGRDTIRITKTMTAIPEKSSGLDGGAKIPGSWKETLSYTVIKSPGEDKFFYDTELNTLQANGNPITGRTSTEFFPNDYFSRTGITTSPKTYLPGRKNDKDFVSLAKLASPELLAYLKIHDRMKYGGLEIVQDAFAEYEKATAYAGTILAVAGAAGILRFGLSGLISPGSNRNILQDIFQLKRLKGNADIAAGTEAEALSIGKSWVNGDNVTTLNIKDGLGWTDGTRTFRLQWKPRQKMWKANFQENTVSATGQITQTKNVHMTVTDKKLNP